VCSLKNISASVKTVRTERLKENRGLWGVWQKERGASNVGGTGEGKELMMM